MPILLALVSAGCVDTAGPKADAPCAVLIESTIPASGEADADYRTGIVFQLSAPDPTATIETDIPGSLARSEDATTVSWVPDYALEPSRAYAATLHYCGGSADLEFRTASMEPPVDPPPLAGRAWAIDLDEGRVVEPAGIGSVVLADAEPILLGVVSEEGGLTLLAAPAAADRAPTGQDWCAPTTSVPVRDYADAPYFEAGPADLVLRVGGAPVTLPGATLSGTFAYDGTYIGAVTLAATLDLRDVASGLDTLDPCALAEDFGSACAACPDDGEPYCLPLVVDELVAAEIDTGLVDIPAADCGGCDTGPPEVCP